jgi:hypothetical protein
MGKVCNLIFMNEEEEEEEEEERESRKELVKVGLQLRGTEGVVPSVCLA